MRQVGLTQGEPVSFRPVVARARSEAEKRRLVLDHLPLTRWVARQVSRQVPGGVPVEDMAQMGVLGLIDAAGRYDAGRGGSFKTYAEYRIRGAIRDGLRDLDWLPRTARRRVRATGSREGSLIPLTAEHLEREASPEAEPETALARREGEERVRRALKQLSPREQTVISFYYYEDFSLQEIGDMMGLTESRVSQLHAGALRRLAGLLRPPRGLPASPAREEGAR